MNAADTFEMTRQEFMELLAKIAGEQRDLQHLLDRLTQRDNLSRPETRVIKS